MVRKQRALGRGLDSLFETDGIEIMDVQKSFEEVKEGEVVQEIEISQIRPNPYQPRKVFEKEKIEELAASIKEYGIFTPIILRKSEVKGYDIVAGERRYRAAKELGLEKIPAVVRDMSEQVVAEIALIENIQREQLNPIEEARAFVQIAKTYEYSQETLAKKFGKSRSHIANTMRLLNLPEEVQEMLSSDKLSMGHARTLLSCETEERMIELAKVIVEKKLSVRETEKLIKEESGIKKPVKKKVEEKDSQILSIEQKLKEELGTAINMTNSFEKGKIEIEYHSKQDLNRILEILGAIE